MLCQAVLDRIYRDEIDHVGIGTRWYRAISERRGVDSEAHFLALEEAFRSGRPVPYDVEGRRAAGFTEHELHGLVEGGAPRAAVPGGAHG